MRTFILLAALVSLAGCSSTPKKSDPFVPRTRKPTTLSQRRLYERTQPSRLAESRAGIEGSVIR